MLQGKILVTGAGGFVGSKLALKLADAGYSVRALCHSKANNKLAHPNIEIAKADIRNRQEVDRAAEGCERIFHVAALANNWSKRVQDFYDVNVQGTVNILEAAKKYGVKRTVITSTAGTIGPAMNGRPATEKENNTSVQFGHYERSKAEAEKKALEFARNGMDVVIVNPTRVYGPGELSKSNAITRIMQKYIHGQWKFKLGNGSHIGNYAFADDVVNGHILAMEKGRAGERYLLGGHNSSFNYFIEILSRVSGIKNILVPVPIALIGAYALTEDLLSAAFGFEARITYAWVRKYKADWTTSCEKAQKELGYTITPFESAIASTVAWIKQYEERL